MNNLKIFLQKVRFFLLPLMLSIYPPIFHYANNLKILLLPSLERILIVAILIAIIIFVIFYIPLKNRVLETSNATFLFLLFFNSYGIAYDFLLKLDKVQVDHYRFFPVFIVAAIYFSWLLAQIKFNQSLTLWKGAILIISVLVFLNLIKIIPTEIMKYKTLRSKEISTIERDFANIQNYPDIYYIVFDEFAGFEAMRNYWKNQNIDNFVQFLKSKGFYIVESSYSSSIDTLHQMAIRLNYQDYPLGASFVPTYYEDIANNRVMYDLKALGYSTAVFDETRVSFAYPAKQPITADYSFEYDSNTITDLGILFDEYGMMVFDKTMLLAFSRNYKVNNPTFVQHKNFVYFTVENIAHSDVPSPKFVYAHLMLPHMPFMFDANGNLVDYKFYQNWNYYLGNYYFAIHIAEKIISNILSDSDEQPLPVIILQSDHGARNKKTANPDSVILDNYPEKYKTNIMFALYLPGYDYSSIPQDLEPINTFPIVFNYLFNTNIPIK